MHIFRFQLKRRITRLEKKIKSLKDTIKSLEHELRGFRSAENRKKRKNILELKKLVREITNAETQEDLNKSSKKLKRIKI